MAVVSPLTNDVSGNIDIAVKELKAGVSPALAIRGLVFRDVRAMLNGGPEQAQHFRDAANAWDGEPDASVRAAYTEMHTEYRGGWWRITAAANRQFIDEHKADTLTFLQTSLAEGVVNQVLNEVQELNAAITMSAETLAAYFMAVTETA